MARTCLVFIIAGLLSLTVRSQEHSAVLMLGETQVDLVTYRSSKPGFLFFNMHDNENTSVEAARKLVRRKGGSLVELRHSGERYIEFEHGDILYSIDPNRIFTDTGVWKELERTGVRDSVVFDMVSGFARQLIEALEIDSQLLVVALHNNTDDNYSVLSYMPGEEYAADAIAIYDSRWRDYDEFYFVTSATLYRRLTTAGFNIVLQNNDNVTDDGSLSVYCGQRSIDYINVEAQHGHKRPNRRMIRRMLRAFAEGV